MTIYNIRMEALVDAILHSDYNLGFFLTPRDPIQRGDVWVRKEGNQYSCFVADRFIDTTLAQNRQRDPGFDPWTVFRPTNDFFIKFDIDRPPWWNDPPVAVVRKVLPRRFPLNAKYAKPLPLP